MEGSAINIPQPIYQTLFFEGLAGSETTLCEGHSPYMGNFYCTFTHLYTPDLMKEIAPVVGN